MTLRSSITRRTALAALGAAGMAAALPLPAFGSVATLRDACRALGIRHGAARDHLIDPDDPMLDGLMARECDVVVPENGGKWGLLQPQPGRFDWRRFDRAVELARSIGAAPVWHTVLWQTESMPDYMKLPAAGPVQGEEARIFSPHGTLSPANQWERFTGHVAAVKQRYGDVFYRIDVANEVFFWETVDSHPGDQDRWGFRRGLWWRVAGGERGPEWLDPYFHHMRREFPSARLVINEFGIELNEGWQHRKRAYLLDWLKGAVRRGVPLDGVGLQSHLIGGKPYDRDGMRAFYRAVDRLGLPVHITEMDVDETRLPVRWSRQDKDRMLAGLAGDFLTDALSTATVAEVTWWHLRSDLNYIARQYPDLKPHPSPYDAAGNRLPLYEAALRALGRPGNRRA